MQRGPQRGWYPECPSRVHLQQVLWKESWVSPPWPLRHTLYHTSPPFCACLGGSSPTVPGPLVWRRLSGGGWGGWKPHAAAGLGPPWALLMGSVTISTCVGWIVPPERHVAAQPLSSHPLLRVISHPSAFRMNSLVGLTCVSHLAPCKDFRQQLLSLVCQKVYLFYFFKTD